MKLTIIGGSSVNTPALFAALSVDDGWLDQIWLVGRSAADVERVGKYCQKVAERRRLPLQLTWDTDLARAAAGADVVLNVLRVGGVQAAAEDPSHFTGSPVPGHAATYPEAVRNLPATLSAAQVVERVAPQALWANFANPVTILCEALALHTRLRCVGICSQAFAIRRNLAALLGIPAARLRVEYYGLNHLGWVCEVLVDGASRMDQLASCVWSRAPGRGSYRQAQWPLIPIDHAFDLYRTGDARLGWRARLMGGLYSIGLRLGLPRRYGRQRRQRGRLRRIIEALDVDSIAEFATQAPWYAGCILPFLAAVAANVPHEFILTWNHAGQLATLPPATAESSVVITGKEVRAAGQTRHLPQAEADWLRQVRNSERLLIRAVVERSPDLAVEAWAAHPGVGSLAQAERLALSYFRV